MAAAQAAARRAVEATERQARERTEAGLGLDGLAAPSRQSLRQIPIVAAAQNALSGTFSMMTGTPGSVTELEVLNGANRALVIDSDDRSR